MYRPVPKKSTIFKIIYLVVSAAIIGYMAYLLIDYIVYGFKSKITFDDIIVLISSVVALLFEGSITGFIIRSFKAPTILMKNLVFKNDGTPYLAGIIVILAGTLICCAATVTFFVSAYAKSLFEIAIRAQKFISSVFLTLFVNLAFCEIYFLTFRHESGTFTII